MINAKVIIYYKNGNHIIIDDFNSMGDMLKYISLCEMALNGKVMDFKTVPMLKGIVGYNIKRNCE